MAQYEYSASAGNDMLEQEIDGREELVGCWAILPDAAAEGPAPQGLPERMKASRMLQMIVVREQPRVAVAR